MTHNIVSITYTLKKEGFGGGGTRALQFKQVQGVGDFPTIKPSGKSCIITIQPGLPSNTRKFGRFSSNVKLNVTVCAAPGFHSGSVRKPRQGTGTRYLQQQQSSSEFHGYQRTVGSLVTSLSVNQWLVIPQGSGSSRRSSSRPALHSKGQAGKAKKGGFIDPNADFLRPQRE